MERKVEELIQQFLTFRKTKLFWSSEQNQKNFVAMIASKYNIEHPSQWRRVSLSLILANGGKVRIHDDGADNEGLLDKHNSSLVSVLSFCYPGKWQSLVIA